MRIRREEEGIVTQADVYDWLLAQKILEPAVMQLGDRFIVGRWVDAFEELPNKYICRIGKVAILVLGEGDTLEAAHAAAKERLK